MNSFSELEEITLQMNLSPSLPLSTGYPAHLEQLVHDLIENAIHAIQNSKQGNEITLQTSAKDHFLLLQVKDNGPGIASEHLSKVFEPFFTIRESAGEIGLGLAIAQDIVLRHQGQIDIKSELGQGTTVRVVLPSRDAINGVSTAPGQTQEPAPTYGRLGSHGELPLPVVAPAVPTANNVSSLGKILMIDDDPDIGILADALITVGYKVTTRSNGASGFEALKAQNYDLVLCDINMPIMDGKLFYFQLVSQFPEMETKTIFITGDNLSRETRIFLERTQRSCLKKPFSFTDLKKTIQQALESQKS